LSRRWNNTLMWSHYSKAHKGFCIGFNKNDEFFNKRGKTNVLDQGYQPVEYSKNRIRVPTEKGKVVSLKVLLTKSIDWKYEEEERLIAFLVNSDQKIKQ